MASFNFKMAKNDTTKLLGLVNKVKKQFISDASKELKEIIIDENILKGNSPVKGEGRYQKYSKSYETAIRAGRYSEYGKKTRPVNLKLSGEMLDSFFIKPIPDGIRIGFSDKKAVYHNIQGAGKSKTKRQLLPNDEQEFKPSIIKRIREILLEAVNKVLANL